MFQLCHVVESKDIKTTTDHTANGECFEMNSYENNFGLTSLTVVKSIYDDLGGLSKIVSNLEIAQISM